MPVASQLRSIARLEYGLLRTVAWAIDRRVGPVADSTPGVDAVYAKVTDALRSLDDRVTGHAAPASAPVAPRPAAPAARRPAPKPEQSDPGVADTDEVEDLAEEYLEAEDEHHTGELADNEDLREVQARLRAKHTLQERDEPGN